jgi:hypothetical protein
MNLDDFMEKDRNDFEPMKFSMIEAECEEIDNCK